MKNHIVYLNHKNRSSYKLILKAYAKQVLLDKGEVHYLDLSTDSDRFDGLLPECYYYGDESAFESFLLNITIDLKKRLTILQNGESVDNYPFVTVIVVDIENENNQLSLSTAIAPYIDYIRSLKYAFFLLGLDLKLANSN
ncbi:hypothetical protein EHV15_35255 [Paenibacillus oralis]|uniref:Uncharacterized protein n=1 Tax=Paenibacillus oralis TaxID=2490856 RepID=A0A3P3TEH4_9BACL|nr:hypothetical protein [Paenibacillus oralis]RRJ54833.1 hypothetical protein EHV15_35255 [Paenibacillus oralis]